MNSNQDPLLEDFLHFLDQGTSPWHVVEEAAARLVQAGFKPLNDKNKWALEPGQKYFVQHEGGSLCAWITPKEFPQGLDLAAAHTDSPTFRLKPNAEYLQNNMAMVGLEIYGAPLLSAWLNRDLGIAGRVFIEKETGIEARLVKLPIGLVIPQLAIHLDREVNDKGLCLNKQDHLAALIAINWPNEKEMPLKTELKEAVNDENILSADLFLYPLEKAARIGWQGELIASARLDNLSSVHAALTTLCSAQAGQDRLKMALFWNHEEIGSQTAQGAGSPFFMHLLERIVLASNGTREDFLRLLRHSMALSIDLAHALHPNYTEKHEPRHQPLLSSGVVLKFSAQQKYATDGLSEAFLHSLCRKANLKPLQKLVSRGDIPSGSTVGPIHATNTGMTTVDLGIPQLSMHSSRELVSAEDQITLTELLKAYFGSSA